MKPLGLGQADCNSEKERCFYILFISKKYNSVVELFLNI
jgi:hypothetical protein